LGKKTAQSAKTAPNHMKTPNLTLDYLTRKRGIRSNGIQEKAQAVNGGICLIPLSRLE
jgi:hypothetical protein